MLFSAQLKHYAVQHFLNFYKKSKYSLSTTLMMVFLLSHFLLFANESNNAEKSFFQQQLVLVKQQLVQQLHTYSSVKLSTDNSDFSSLPPATISGNVFGDYNYNGVDDQIDAGLQGIQVQAYAADGTLAKSATTNSNGSYSLTGLEQGEKYRIEFTLPSSLNGWESTHAGSDAKGKIRFVNAPATVKLGLAHPSDYCQDNPFVATACYVEGDPLKSGTTGYREWHVTFNYNNQGEKGTAGYDNPSYMVDGKVIGSTWGIAYHKPTNNLIMSSLIKRHCGLGQLGTGGLYKLDYNNGQPVPSIWLNANGLTGFYAGNNPRDGSSNNSLAGSPNTNSRDVNAFYEVGKAAIGGIDFSDDGNDLYVLNLKDRKVYELNVGQNLTSPSSYSQVFDVIAPMSSLFSNGCNNADYRPWAVKYYHGRLYIGLVCSAESSQNTSQLRGYIISIDPKNAGAGFSAVFDFPLTYNRDVVIDYQGDNIDADWRPWITNWNQATVVGGSNNTAAPQPILSDIEFDVDGSLLIGLTDRFGHQSGFQSYSPNTNDNTLYIGMTAGDILRACKSGSSYTIEGNSGCNYNNSWEYYNRDFFYSSNVFGAALSHQEIATGGLAMLAGSGDVASTIFDPYWIQSGGIAYWHNNDATIDHLYELYNFDMVTQSGPFGKANGLGDIELFCEPAPMEIGNYVWEDTDGDGVQDADEPPLSNITVELYNSSGGLIHTTTTNNNGEYYFNTNSTGGQLQPNTDYFLAFGNGQFDKDTYTLNGDKILTASNQGFGTNADLNDSDATISYSVTYPFNKLPHISFTTGNAGTTNHSLDVGFYPGTLDVGCNCGENLLPNGSFEYNDGSYAFSIPFETNPSDTMSNAGHYNTVYNWNPGLSGDYMFYIDDRSDQVNNPDGDYFVWLPAIDDCWVGNKNFTTSLGFEDGQQYQLCFYAASWNISRNLSTGLPDGGSVSQASTEVKLEMTFSVDGFTEVGSWSVPPSTSWNNLNWQQYTYTFTYDINNGVQNLLFTNGTNVGVAIDAVTISRIDCDNREVCIGDGIDNDGDGLEDCNDPDCYGVGHAQTVVNAHGARSAPDALYAPDGEYAQIYDNWNRLILDLGTTLPTGSEYTIIWKRKSSYSDNAAATIRIEESDDATNFGFNTFEPSTTQKNYAVATRMITQRPTRFLRFRQKANSVDDFDLDAVVYQIDCPGCDERGQIVYEKWTDVNGGNINDLLSHFTYPDYPDEIGTLTSFDFPNNVGDKYGVRVRAYLHPVETGNYTFITTADDASEVYLSTDNTPDNKTRIAYNTNWTNENGTTEYPSQTSNSIFLQAGNKYYIEYLGKESGGGDHFQLFWKTPSNSTATIIAGEYLSPYECVFENCILTMDFETDANGDPLNSGDYLMNAYADWGVTITTDNPSAHPPMVFNSVIPTGGDADLGTPNQDFGGAGIGNGGKAGRIGENSINRGNAMIISENNNPSNPDDNASGGTITLTYDNPVNVAYIELVDADYGETDGRIRTYDATNSLLNETRIIAYGDNSFQYVIVDQDDVSKMEIYFPNSGSVTAIYYCQTLPPYASVGDRVWADTNGDGNQGGNEDGLENVRVVLLDEFGNILAEDITDSNGDYLFPGLMPGSYQVEIDETTTPPNWANTADLDNDLDGHSGVFTLNAGDEKRDVDFGYQLDCQYVDVQNDVITQCPQNSYSGNAATNDGNSAGATYEVTINPTSGTVNMNTNGTFTYTPNSVGCGTDQFTYRAYNPTVDCANTGTVTINMVDGDAPQLSVKPTNITLNCDATIPNAPTVTATDNCVSNVIVDYNQNSTKGSSGCSRYDYVITRTWSASDQCGNQTIHTQTITVEDNTNPTFDNAPPSTTVECDNIPGVPTVTASDNCDNIVKVTFNQADTQGGIGSCENYTITRTWVATDDCNNKTTHTQIITVQDTEDPTLDGIPADETITQLPVPDPPVIGTEITGDDNCDNNVDITFNETRGAGCNYTVVRTWTATDNCNNQTTATQTITVNLSAADAGTLEIDDEFVCLAPRGDGVVSATTDNTPTIPNGYTQLYLLTKGANKVIQQTSNSPSFTTTSAGEYFIHSLVYVATAGEDNYLDLSFINFGTTQLSALTSRIEAGGGDICASLSAGANATVDACDGSIGDFVWEDNNGDGQQTNGEPGIPNVMVVLEGTTPDGETITLTTTTDANGNYIFENLPPGDYTLTFTTPAGFEISYPNQGGNDNNDSDINNSGQITNITLASGENNNSYDAGYYRPAAIGNFVWDDLNGNGIQENGESGISGVTVTINGTTGNGTPFTASTPTNGTGFYEFTNLVPGDYTLTFGNISGFNRTPTDQGNDDAQDSDANTTNGQTGSYTLVSGETNNTVDAGYINTGDTQLGDFVFEDLNANGIQDNGEPGIEGVTVRLDGVNGISLPILTITTTTDANGLYLFDNLEPGVYTVTFETPNGFTPTYRNEGNNDNIDSDPNPLTQQVLGIGLQSGEQNKTIDAGFYKVGSLGDFVWDDLNGNGIQDNGEPGIQGVEVSISGTTGNGTTYNETVTTDANGAYLFDDLIPGTYTVTFNTPTGYATTYANEGVDDEKDSDITATNNTVENIVIQSGENNLSIDAGYYQLGNSIGDYTWEDLNANGIQETGEPAIQGITVLLIGTTGNGTPVSDSRTTDVNGFYEFDDLIPGTYNITFAAPNTLAATYANEGSDDAKDSDPINGIVNNIVVQSGTQNPTIDAGFYQLGNTIGDFVWEDMDGDGIQDNGEPGIQGVTVTLTGTTGNGTPVTVTTTTDANGNYNFTDIIPGTYTVTFGTPNNYTATYPNEGSDDANDSDAINGEVTGIVIQSGDTDLTIDAGFYKLGNTIGDYVWDDTNGNGIQNAGEPAINSVNITLTGTTGNGTAVNETTTTDVNGFYNFTDLVPGTYTVTFATPNGFVPTYANEGGDDEKDSDAVNGEVTNIQVLSGTVNETIDAGFIGGNAKIGDFVWEDINGNGIQDNGEPGIQGVTVTLTGTTGNGTPITETTTTDANGNYIFENLLPGTYEITFATPNNFAATYANEGSDDAKDSDAINGVVSNILIESGTENLTIDAGFYQLGNSIGDYVWEDMNANGIQENSEPAIASVIITLTGTTGNGTAVNATVTTDANGFYEFTDLIPGTYQVAFGTPNNYAATYPNEGSDDAKDSDAINGIVSNILIESGTQNPTIDAGFYQLGNTIGDFVWEDMDGDGIQDNGEPGIQGVTVTLTGTTGNGTPVTVTTTTDANGNYNFTDIIPGTYTVTFGTPNNYTATYPNEGSDDANDSDAINGEVTGIVIQSGDTDLTIDAGFYKLGNTIGDYVWEDINGDGIQGNDEPVISGVGITLTGTTGNGTPVNSTTITDANGLYNFTDLVPGIYTVTFATPNGFVATYPNEGGNDEKDSDAINGEVTNIEILSGTINETIDAGFIAGNAKIGDYVWEDMNGNGMQDNGELGIQGVTVTLTGTTGNGTAVTETTTTDANGNYVFENLLPGIYEVTFDTPNNYAATYANEGSDDALDSDAINGVAANILIESGTENLTIDAGFYKLGNTIGDYTWEDMNANGIQESGEPAIQGITISLTGITGNGTPISETTTTDVNGLYNFTDLVPGTYTVTFDTPNNFAATYANEGSDDELDSDAINGVVDNILIESGTVNNTIDAGFYQLGSQIGDFVFEDLDGDGIQDDGEPGIPNVTVTLTGTTGNGTPVSVTITTDSDGNYLFDDVIPGTYTVTFGTPDGYAETYPNEGGDDANDSDAINGEVTGIVIESGDTDLTIDAGFYQLGNTIGDYVWEDTNGDGIQDAGEPVISGVGITLTGTTGNGTPVNTTTITDANGLYEFTDLVPGTYTVTFATPNNFVPTYTDEGTDDTIDSDPINGEVTGIVIQSGTVNKTIDAGYIAGGAKIGDFVWEDIDGDGIQDDGEPGIAGVEVTLTGTTGNGSTVDITVTTDANGNYLFDNLLPGTYTVTFSTPTNYAGTYPNEGGDDDLDSDAINGVVSNILIESGTEDLSIDAGYYKLGNTIGDYVWEDMNANGIQDSSEPVISGVAVTLTGTTGNGTAVTQNTTTDANGLYNFTDLIPGTYSVTFGTPNNFAATYANEGSDDELDSDAVNGVVDNIEILSGTVNNTIDAGFYQLGSQIGDFVFEDLDGDGIQDDGEPGIPNVTVTLTGTTGNGTPVSVTITTDSDGNYLFDDVIPGTYTVTFGTPDGYAETYPNEGGDDANDSDAINGEVTGIVIQSGDTDLTIDAGFYQLGNTIGDYVWEDTNGDGIQDAGEPVISGVGITLTGTTGNGTPVNTTTITDANGLYEFTDLVPGTYTVTFATPNNFVPTYTDEGTDDTIDSDPINGEVTGIVIQSGTVNKTIDAGYIAGGAKIGDFVWEDIDGDGIQDDGEPGIAGVEVTLTGTTGNGSTVDITVTTDANGNYLFDNLLPGTYTVTFSTPTNYAGTYPNEGGDDDLDSDAINGVVSNILIESGTEDLSIDAGYYKLGNTIGDYVWEDMNANGIQDSSEPVISGVAVTLTGTTGNGTAVTQNTMTDANGLYNFTDLIPGTYSVTFGTPNNFAATYANEGSDDELDSDAINGVVDNILIESGTVNNTIDAGFYKLGNTIGDFVFEDLNGNGIQDNNDPGINNVLVTLTGTTGNGTAITETFTTGTDGLYTFTDLIPGTYTVTFANPTDFTPTFPNQGSDDTKDSDVENGQVTGIVVVSGTVNNTIDAGYFGAKSQIGNYVWIDMNGDGLQDTIREAGLEDVTVTLYYNDVNGNPQTQTTLTDIDGYYLFDKLAPGTYSVGFENMPDYSFTAVDQGTDDALDSDVNIATGRTPEVTLGSGESNLTLDAGFVNLTTYIGNYVWIDQNGNGLQDQEEPGVPNVTVTLTGTTGSGEVVNRTLTTDADGFYMFTEVFPGDYEVTFSLPAGYKFTYQDEGSADFYDSDVDPATNKVVNISTYSGLPNITIDAGIYQPARVGNYVWEDNDGDGLQGPDEVGIEGMTLYLQGTTGNGTVVNTSTTTDATGYYIFDDLVPGTYQVFFDLPSNFVTTVDDQTFVQVDELPATAVLINDDYNVDGPFEIEVFFSEPVNGLTAADFDLTNATITNITGDGEYYMVEVTPTADGMVYVSLPNGTTTDEAGNSSASSNTISVNFDMNNAIKAETGMVANVGSNWQTITLNENYVSPVVIATVTYPDGSSLPAVSRIRNAGGNSFELRLQNPSDTPLPADYTVNYFVIEEGVYTEEVHGVDLEAVLATTSVTASSGNWVQEPRAYQQSYDDPVVVGQVMSYNDPDWSSFWASANNRKNPANASELNAGIQVGEDTDTDRANETIGYIVLNEGSGVIGDWQFTADTGDRIVRGPDNFYYGAGYDYYFYGMSAPTSAIVSQAGMRSTDGGWAVLAGGSSAVNPNSIALLADQDQIQDGERYNTRERVDYIVFEPAGGNNNLPAIVPPSVTLTTSSYTVTGEFTVDINSLVGLNDLTASDFIITNGTVGALTGNNGDYQLTITPTNGGLVTIEIPSNAVTNDNGDPNFVSNTLNVFYEELSATPYSTIYPAGTGADEVDSDPDGNTSKTPVFVLYSGDENLTIDAGVIGKTALGDFVWEDLNANGIQDDGEPGIANVTVTLTGTTGDGTIVNETTTTDGLGLYAFNDLLPGTYTVTFATPNGFSATYSDEGSDDEKDSDAINGVVADIVVTSSNPNLTIDAGFYKTDNRLGDYVWEDVNGNGLNDSGEPAVNNVSVTLNGTTGNGTPVTNVTTTTDANGYYQFTNIIPGNYSITFGEPTGYQITHANQGTDDTIDSDPSRGTGTVNNITVISGTDDQTIDAGLVKTNTGVGDYVWEDVNGNGVQDNGEPGIVGHTVTLNGTDNIGNPITRTTTTDANGYYEFVGLFPGTYTVTFDLPGTVIPTFVDLGGDDATDSDADPITGAAPAVTLLSGDFDDSIDAGFYSPVTIGDYVWLDENQNGTQDEPTATAGINGVVVNLYYGNCGQAANGSTPYRTTTTTINPSTNEPGWYEFADIPRGDYCVSIDASNFTQGNALVGKFASPANATGDDATDSDGGNNHRVFLDDVTSNNPNVDFGYYGTPDAEEGFCYVIADAGDYFALIDQTTGQLMVIGQVAPPDGENLAANPLTLEVYNVSGENAATSLITIDDQTGATNVLNADIGLDDVDALAFSPFTNELYAMKADPIPGELYRVDKNTGATQLMTSISLSGADPLAGELDPHIDGMSFHPQTRELYGVYSAYGSASYLVKIDTTSGVATFVGTDGLTGVDDIEDISFAPDGTLYGVLGDQGAIGNDAGGTYEGLVTIDPNTAQATPIGLYGTPVAGITWDVEAFACLVPPSCGIDITNIDPGDCYNSDGTSRSDITVTVAWTNAPSDENIIVSVNGQQQTIAVTAGSSSNADVQFIMPSDQQDYEITATFETGNCTNIATQTYTAPEPCCYVEIRSVKPYPCIGDKYDADVVVFYADHVGKQITINGQTFGTADSTGIEKFLVKNLDCGLAMEDIVVTFADEPAACTDTKSFTPPGPCSVTIDSVVPTACALDKYDIAITFTFANPPSEIDINGCRFRPSGQSGTETFLLKGQDCATASDLPLTITFVDDGGCNDGDVITAPCPQPRVCAPGAEVGRTP